MNPREIHRAPGLVSALPGWAAHAPAPANPVIGVLPGEGIGPEIIEVALGVLDCVARATGTGFEVITGGKIGKPAQVETGRSLSAEVIDFCQSVFDRRGAVFCGPGGGRFVYELRAHFDLFCKFTPIVPLPALDDAGVIRPEARRGVDIVVVRENTGGLYFGDSRIVDDDGLAATHTFGYKQAHVRRILQTAIGLAQRRRGRLCVVLKPGGIPAISDLWQQELDALAGAAGLAPEVLEVDNAMYQLIADAGRFDVMVAPNMFGDILSDGASLLLGSRGMSFSGNFGAPGRAVYQTGHGAAHDLAGSDRANPVGQVVSLAMMLRESFAMHGAAAAVEAAVQATLQAGWRTADIAGPGSRVVGTREMGAQITGRLEDLPIPAPERR